MKFALENSAELRIHAYEAGEISIAVPSGLELDLAIDPESGLCRLQRGFIMTARQLYTDWQPATFAELTAAHFDDVLALKPELILLGTGATLQFPAADILAPVHQAGLGIEIMGTAAACRTFNILVDEGRNVAAALLMI
ncbi:MAG: MTH938/NDUFAF3 family protein [Proteobacteria bacterium]|nr:MTH938/NDUFAF3 family protein [Pseudomonadota bacterium]